MAEKEVKIRITTQTFVSGDYCDVGDEPTVPESTAKQLIRLGRAVPAEKQTRKPAAKKKAAPKK